ncbi:hypothetical protein PTKIN_Ptkin13bG0185700 [Pterospermum kingtungense]
MEERLRAAAQSGSIARLYELPYSPGIANGQAEVVFHLLSVDKDLVRVKGRGGSTPLHYVAGVGNLCLLAKFLLSSPECINDVTTRNETALHIAAQYNKLEVLEILVRWLLRAYKNWEKYLEWKDKEGNTVLHVAASMNQPQMIRVLIESKARVNIINSSNLTALDVLQSLTQVDTKESMDILRRAGSLNASSISRASTLEEKLRSNITRSENAGRFWIAFAGSISADTRNALLVVCGLILAATYQTTLSPPPAGASQAGVGFTSHEGTLIRAPAKVDDSVMDKYDYSGHTISTFLAFCTTLLLTYFLLLTVPRGLMYPLVMSLAFLLYSFVTALYVQITPVTHQGRLNAAHCISSVLFMAAPVIFSAILSDRLVAYLRRLWNFPPSQR